MKLTLLLLLLSLFGSFNLRGQNLVINSSFEMINKMPDKKGNSINRSQNWNAVTTGYSDYYHRDAQRAVSVPKNRFGKQNPHSGKAYAGICIRTKFLEYIGTQLKDTLTKDQEYLVEFYISRAERSLGSVKEFGVMFNSKNIWGVSDRGISTEPQVDFIDPKGYKDKKNWVKLSGIYKANGNESHIIIGYFNYDPANKKRRIFAHYYIDDVSITPYEKKVDSIQLPNMVGSSPEIFSPIPGEKITLKNIFFQTNKSELLPSSFPELDNLVEYLKQNNHSIEIIGHTDNTGKEEQNKSLSKARAKAVSDYLIQKGIDEARINYNGAGSSNPIASNNTEEGKQQNRRVEFVIKE